MEKEKKTETEKKEETPNVIENVKNKLIELNQKVHKAIGESTDSVEDFHKKLAQKP